VKKTDFDKKVKDLLRPKPLRLTVVLDGKNLVYPKQPRLPKPIPTIIEVFGISVKNYSHISVVGNWSALGDSWVSVKTIKEQLKNLKGEIIRDDFEGNNIYNHSPSPFIVDLPQNEGFEQVIFELHNLNPKSVKWPSVVIDVQLNP